ncbi:MAG: hypothetical protein OQK98_14990 [Gammaproteobacteria bacterium]|nr:hypothetical protein [Gammaproteobacteria bacterium]
MEVRKKLKPGAHGTKRLQRIYGDDLICVRYRYDEEKSTRYTTVELIVDKQPYAKGFLIKKYDSPYPDDYYSPLLNVKISYQDLEMRMKVKNAGGIWDAENKYWKLDRHQVKNLGLEKCVV